jgi:cell surface protein SprA
LGKRYFVFRLFLVVFLFFCLTKSYSQDSIAYRKDPTPLTYPLKDFPFSRLYPQKAGIDFAIPSNIQREVEFDSKTKKYIIRDRLGNQMFRPPLVLSMDEYKRYEESLLKKENWKNFSDTFSAEARRKNLLPSIEIRSESFKRIFGGSEINIIPRGSADITLMGQHNKNENPLFNERQRNQYNFDFDQRIQMNLTGQIGDLVKVSANYNTESQFDFENQLRLDYVGKDDDIIQKIELGNVSLPLSSSLISGSQALFGVKTQLQFGRVQLTSVFSQHKSQQKEITISNGAQQNEFAFSADNYEANRHYFLAQYFRDNYNRAMSTAPVIQSNIHITQIEVWITNRSNTIDNARDVLAFMDLAEHRPYNTGMLNSGNSVLPAAGLIDDPNYPQQSNNLLQILPPDIRFTNSNSIQSLFQGNGGTDNYAKLTSARKLTEREFTLDPRLGYISLNLPLNVDQVLAVAYRYTANGQEYQVGEFSTDVPVDPSNPQVLYTKLLKNETLKTNLPIWDLMMKNIYSIGAYRIGRSNFVFNIYRTENESGVDRPVISEGQSLINKLWLQVTGLDRLNAQNDRQPDGVFDFLEGITIDSEQGRVKFPVIEPFGNDLANQFDQFTEQNLIDKYTFQALYDSTKVIAQQLYPGQNRFVIKGTYESEAGAEFQLDAFNVPRGSVQVYSGSIPLNEGTDFTIDYEVGRLRILNEALLNSGQPIRIKLENNELFGLQQKSMVGSRLDYFVNDKFHFGATFLNLTEKPLTQKVNLAEEPISNTMYGFDLNYNSSSRWLTRMVDKIPFINTSEPSSFSFFGEFAALKPGHPRALNVAGNRGGVSYIDDFENSQSIIDLKGAINWQISGTPQYFPESQYENDLRYGFNRARLAFYNIDPVFYRNSSLTPSNIRGNRDELSLHSVREVLEQEVFPFKESSTGQPLHLSTLDLSYYPTVRGPFNYTTSGLNADGTLLDPKSRWGGIVRKIETPDFESQNIEFIELWMMDPFIDKPSSEGGSIYFNLGNISEDILKDGRKSLENGMPTNGDYSQTDTTVWGRVPKNQPIIQAFDNDPAARALQDIGLDGLNDDDEKVHFSSYLNQLPSQIRQDVEKDPSNDNFEYYLGPSLDASSAGILKRYEKYNGTENNSRTSDQARQELGIDNAASTLLPDGEDINRDNNMNQIE